MTLGAPLLSNKLQENLRMPFSSSPDSMAKRIATVRVSMAKPSWVVRAELPRAPDLFAEMSIPRSGSSSSSRRRDLVFVVNPSGANGRTGKEWKKLLPYLRSRLGADCNGAKSSRD